MIASRWLTLQKLPNALYTQKYSEDLAFFNKEKKLTQMQ